MQMQGNNFDSLFFQELVQATEFGNIWQNITQQQGFQQVLQQMKQDVASKSMNFDQLKNVMIIGQTGSGKTSTINHCSDVNISEVTKSLESQTKGISSIPVLPLGIRLFDTPGFNDTSNLSDTGIMSMILHEIVTETLSRKLDAIIIVQSASEDRYSSMKIIDRLKQIFGDDIAKSIIVILSKVESKMEDQGDLDDYLSKEGELVQYFDHIKQQGVSTQPIFWSNDPKKGPKRFGFNNKDFAGLQQMQRYILYKTIQDMAQSSSQIFNDISNAYLDIQTEVENLLGMNFTIFNDQVPIPESTYHEAEYKAYHDSFGNACAAIFSFGIAVAAGGTSKKIKNEYWAFPSNEKSITVMCAGDKVIRNVVITLTGGSGYASWAKNNSQMASVKLNQYSSENYSNSMTPYSASIKIITQDAPGDAQLAKITEKVQDLISQNMVQADGVKFKNIVQLKNDAIGQFKQEKEEYINLLK